MNLAMQQSPRQAASPAVNMLVAVGRGAPAVGSPGRNAPPRYDKVPENVPEIVPQPKQNGKAPPKPPRPSPSPYGLAPARQQNIGNPIIYSALPNGGNKASPKSGSGARMVDRQVAAARPIVPSNNQSRAAASPSRWQRFKAFVAKWVFGRRPAAPGRAVPVNQNLLNDLKRLASQVPVQSNVAPVAIPINRPAGPAGPAVVVPVIAARGAPLQVPKEPKPSPRIQPIPNGPSDSHRARNPYGVLPQRSNAYDTPVLKNRVYDDAQSPLKN